MASALEKLNKLEILNLGDCLLKSNGTKLICKALSGRHPNLRELDLDSNEIRLNGGLEIVKAIQDKNKLEKLGIDANQFGESGLKQLLKKISEIGKEDIVGETEDNEEPDSDEEDLDVSDDEHLDVEDVSEDEHLDVSDDEHTVGEDEHLDVEDIGEDEQTWSAPREIQVRRPCCKCGTSSHPPP